MSFLVFYIFYFESGIGIGDEKFKEMRTYFFLGFFLFVANPAVFGQTCGTVPTVEQLQFMNDIHKSSTTKPFGRTQLTVIKIPLKIHAVRPSVGTGGGFSEAQLTNLFSKLNAYYINAGIEFFKFGEVNNIVSDSYYNLNSANEGGLAVPNDVSNVINVYFTNTLITNGTPLCGYTRFPPSSDRVFTTYGCALGGTTLEHELGHYFTLFHTHGTTNTGTTDELVNGSNCQNAGDRLCDTPADPNLTGKVSASCAYTGVDRDANGQAFSPNVRNIMAYSRDACQDFFSIGQYERVRNGYENGRNYLLIQSDEFTTSIFTQTRNVCKGATVNFSATGSGATSWAWEFTGGTPAASTERAPKVRYNTGGSFSVKLTARAANGQTVTTERANFITVTDPLDFALSGNLSYTFDSSLPQAFSIVNPDQSLTFSFSSIDRSGAASGSVYVNNYNYASDRFINYDQLVSPFLNNKGVKKFQISFDVSYSSRSGGLDGANLRPDAFDSLAVSIYNQCGKTPNQIWKQGGSVLQTVPIQSNEFFPSPTQWKNVDLTVNVADEEFTQVNWTNTSVNGNNLFIDNIVIVPDYSLASPSDFRASNITPTGVTLRWTDNSTNETNFVIERSEGDGAFSEIAKLPKNDISFIDQNIVIGKKYKYKIFAVGFGTFRSPAIPPISVDFLVTSLEEDFQIHVYPNPFVETLTIENNKKEKCVAQIFSVLGVALPEVYLNQNSKVELMLEHLNVGVYLMKVTYPASVRYFKINKLR